MLTFASNNKNNQFMKRTLLLMSLMVAFLSNAQALFADDNASTETTDPTKQGVITTPPAGDEPDPARLREVKVLEAADGAVAQVCHVLAGTSPPALLREKGVCRQGAPGVRTVHAPHAVRAPEVADEARLVGAHARQGAR